MKNKIVDVRYLSEYREIEVKFSSGARLGCAVDSLEILNWMGSGFFGRHDILASSYLMSEFGRVDTLFLLLHKCFENKLD